MKPRILIVDDDDAITQQLFWTLCDEYEVMTANDMPTAIRQCRSHLSLRLEIVAHCRIAVGMSLAVITSYSSHRVQNNCCVIASSSSTIKILASLGVLLVYRLDQRLSNDYSVSLITND